MTMETQTRFDWGAIGRLGLLAGVIALSLCAIGVVGTFAEVDVIGGVFTVGHVFLFGTTMGCAFLAAQRGGGERTGQSLVGGLVLGLLSSLPVILLIIVGGLVDAEGELLLRQFLPNVSHDLLDMLTFGCGQVVGSLILAAVASVLPSSTATTV